MGSLEGRPKASSKTPSNTVEIVSQIPQSAFVTDRPARLRSCSTARRTGADHGHFVKQHWSPHAAAPPVVSLLQSARGPHPLLHSRS